MSFVLACSKVWNSEMAQRLSEVVGDEFVLISQKDELNYDNLKRINPKKIFFPHWSYILKSDIYKNFDCVMFHMTDLPYGRGGSPLQNLIARGHTETKISAFKCDGGVDTGPIYLKKELSLVGNAQEIYSRASVLIEQMIVEIVKASPEPKVQVGEVVEFKRRKPEDSDIGQIADPKVIFDYIRMLDADGYPKAFFKNGNIRFEFSGAVFDGTAIDAKVRIYREE